MIQYSRDQDRPHNTTKTQEENIMYRIPLYITGKYSIIIFKLLNATTNTLNNIIDHEIETGHTSRFERNIVPVLFRIEYILSQHNLSLVRHENKVLARHNML